MIKGIHGLFYSSDPDATRAFFKEKVKLPGSDIGGGWWIFDFAEGDLGVHPIEEGGTGGGHDISFYCDDIEGTVKDLKSRGVSFTKDIADHGYGLVTYFSAPGGITVQLYEPRYTKGASRKKPAKKSAKKKATAKKAPAKKAPKKKPAKKPAAKKKAKR
ncbi:MAG: VOC family protein [Deltaproteobacteria bacterium]|nr:VOC family protein [Deltaproteobacteria bacterium]